MSTSDEPELFEYLIFDYQLPYRLFLDDAVYWVRSDDVRWRMSLRTESDPEISYTTPSVNLGDRSQLHLDSHGYTGHTQVRVR